MGVCSRHHPFHGCCSGGQLLLLLLSVEGNGERTRRKVVAVEDKGYEDGYCVVEVEGSTHGAVAVAEAAGNNHVDDAGAAEQVELGAVHRDENPVESSTQSVEPRTPSTGYVTVYRPQTRNPKVLRIPCI